MTVTRGALILLLTSGLSYVLGLMRDRVLAGTFGATNAFDAYQASFVLPDFIFNLFVAGALSAAFIPVFTDLQTKRKIKTASQLAGSLLTLGLLVLIGVNLITFIFANPLVRLVAPGFSPDQLNLLANLTRILLLSPLLFFASNLLGNMLISSKRFFFYGLSPALYNLGIILGAIYLSPYIGIYGAAIGTILGAFLHLLARLLDLKLSHLSLSPSFQITTPLKRVFKLMLPRVAALTAFQIQLWAFTAIASTLGEGAVTIYNLARNFQSFPVSLLGIAFATSLFPHLAELASQKKLRSFQSQLLKSSLLMLAIIIPAAISIYFLRAFIIQIFVGTGRFDEQAVALTAAVLGVYTLSIPTESLVHILARAFYAFQNTLIPTLISLLAISTSISSAFYLVKNLGVLGIPAGFAIGTGLQTVLLLILLKPVSQKKLSKLVAQ